jgi:hypothetical protein
MSPRARRSRAKPRLRCPGRPARTYHRDPGALRSASGLWWCRSVQAISTASFGRSRRSPRMCWPSHQAPPRWSLARPSAGIPPAAQHPLRGSRAAHAGVRWRGPITTRQTSQRRQLDYFEASPPRSTRAAKWKSWASALTGTDLGAPPANATEPTNSRSATAGRAHKEDLLRATTHCGACTRPRSPACSALARRNVGNGEGGGPIGTLQCRLPCYGPEGGRPQVPSRDLPGMRLPDAGCS